MVLTVIGSSSAGNGYVIQNEKEALVLEAGKPFREVKKYIGYDIRKIKGVCVSHIHGDHAKYLKEYQRLYPIYAPALGYGSCSKAERYGDFKVKAFDVDHDDTPCCGFYVTHPDMGNLVFLTDAGYCRYSFRHLAVQHLMVECNYQDSKFEVKTAKADHVLRGHMSEKTMHEFIRSNSSECLSDVVILHLSEDNAEYGEVLANIRKVVKKGTGAFVAYPGLNITLRRHVE